LSQRMSTINASKTIAEADRAVVWRRRSWRRQLDHLHRRLVPRRPRHPRCN
jgi:uncharacterized protein (DUF2062 family)